MVTTQTKKSPDEGSPHNECASFHVSISRSSLETVKARKQYYRPPRASKIRDCGGLCVAARDRSNTSLRIEARHTTTTLLNYVAQRIAGGRIIAKHWIIKNARGGGSQLYITQTNGRGECRPTITLATTIRLTAVLFFELGPPYIHLSRLSSLYPTPPRTGVHIIWKNVPAHASPEQLGPICDV